MSKNENDKKDLIKLLWEECQKSNINTEPFEKLMIDWSGENWWNEKDPVEKWEGFIHNINLKKYDVDMQEIVENTELLNDLLKYAGYGLYSSEKKDDLKKAKDKFEKEAGLKLNKDINFDSGNPTLQKFLLGDCSKVLIGNGAGAPLPGRLTYNIENGDVSTYDRSNFSINKGDLINEISLYKSIIESNSLEDVVISEDDEPCKLILEGKDKLPHFIAKILSLVVFERGWDLISTTDCIGLFKLLFNRLDHEDEIEDFLEQYNNIPYIDNEKKRNLADWFEKYKNTTEDKDRDKELKNNLLKCIYFGTKMLRYCLDENNTELEKSDKKDIRLENFKLLKCMEKLVYPIISDRDTFNKIETDAPIIYTGAPGTGKTYGIENYVKGRCIAKPMKKTENLPDDFLQYKIVQFHSSYDYTDFVEGIRPIPDPKGDNKTIFVRVDGIFKEFCRNVELYNRNGDPKGNIEDNRVEQDKFYFIIDEINRADLGKVFGELMYCFEKDKRGPKHSVTTQYSNLITYKPKECSQYVKIKKDEDVFAEGFFIPENVIIIGSMNDIDRSVETFDFALRRRFTWITLDTDKMVKQVLGDLGINEYEQNCVINMNKVIYGEIGANLGLNKTYCIGPAHFKKLANVTKGEDAYKKEKNAIWENTVCQVLREYTRGRAAEDVNELLLACYKSFMGDDSINELPGEEEVDYCNIIGKVANDEDTSKQIVFTGAPGTGKTYGIEHAVEDLAKEQAKQAGNVEQAKKYYKFVQFHSSYDYTDFIEGLRPIDGDKEGPVFVKMEGEFKKFCRQAAEDDENKYYFIIDEINRADLGKVFGELMYCFEYRGKDNAIQIQYSNLVTYEEKEGKYSPIEGNDVFEKGFYIPNNVVIIGSMNDIDRSVETFDFALRRRFKWVEVKANEKNYEKVFKGIKGDKPLTPADIGAIKQIVNMNKIISGPGPDEGAQFGLNDSYWIGPSFFKEYIKTNKDKDWNDIWENRIEPTIREYVRGRNSNSVENFILKCKGALIPKKEAL